MLEEATKNEVRVFNHYKRLLSKDGHNNRFVVIEYVCRTPKINPYMMASVLMDEGYNILFDDSSISQKENDKKFKKCLQMGKGKNVYNRLFR